ncbi:hypothetical protein SeLEV6574_g00361 [Synchytrium endobioticum]|uniref:C3H1-type domain-containing protein n=1 Tax=Synchytrium endobioticum TaxID=286115 RepID=A0A507DK63_9FUNG|nr:hypothetical protein SeLEV6574_g00361 [Synchytrium endobioticum]
MSTNPQTSSFEHISDKLVNMEIDDPDQAASMEIQRQAAQREQEAQEEVRRLQQMAIAKKAAEVREVNLKSNFPVKKVLSEVAATLLLARHSQILPSPSLSQAEEDLVYVKESTVYSDIKRVLEQQTYFIALSRTEQFLKEVADIKLNPLHLKVYADQEKMVLAEIASSTGIIAHYLTNILKADIAHVSRQMGTTHSFLGTGLVAPRERNHTMPLSLVLMAPSGAPTLAPAKKTAGTPPLTTTGSSRLDYQPWNGKSSYDTWLEGFEMSCRMSGITGDALLNTFLAHIPEGTRHQAKFVLNADGHQSPCKAYADAKENYRTSIYDAAVAGGLNNATRAISSLKMKSTETYPEYIDRSLRLGDGYKQNRYAGYMNEGSEYTTQNELAAAWTNADLVHHIMSGFPQEVQDELESVHPDELGNLKKALSTFSRVYKLVDARKGTPKMQHHAHTHRSGATAKRQRSQSPQRNTGQHHTRRNRDGDWASVCRHGAACRRNGTGACPFTHPSPDKGQIEASAQKHPAPLVAESSRGRDPNNTSLETKQLPYWCQYCRNKGHTVDECFKLKRDEARKRPPGTK